MVSLTDIAPATARVAVLGSEIEVRGLTMRDIAHLLSRFPQLRMIVAGRQESLTVDDIIAAAPDAIASIIACGTGGRDDDAAHAAADALPVEAQTDVIEAIVALSFPKGFGPFVARLMAMAGQLQSAVVGTTPSPPPSNS
jgi:hypothetical protein